METWILLRGLTREAGHWGPFLPALEAALPSVRVLALDLPGAGARAADRWPATVDDAMEAVRAEALAKASGPLFVFGVSLGGMVTMSWAARHPGELRGVAVGASSARDVGAPWRRMRPRALLSLLLRRDEASIVRTISNRRDLWDETTARWTEIRRLRPLPPGTARGQMLSAMRWSAPPKLDVPALFLVGDGDRLVHPSCSERLAARYRAPLVRHPDAGHDLTTDAPAWVAEELVRFRTGLQR